MSDTPRTDAAAKAKGLYRHWEKNLPTRFLAVVKESEKLERELAEARAECDRLRADAERYQWLANEFADGHARHPALDTAVDIDAAIDEARKC